MTPDEIRQQRIARLKTRSVLIGTPSHGRPAWAYVSSLLDTQALLTQAGIAHDFLPLRNRSILPGARNVICAWFLASEYTDLIFIDDDMGWPALGLVKKLLASPQHVIGAAGRRKTDEHVSWCVRPLEEHDQGQYLDDMGAIEMRCVGTGVLKITREALELIAAARPDLKLDGDDGMPPEVAARHYKFFQYGQREEGEDYVFCDLWRSLGGSVWVAPDIEVSHVGEKEYVGTLAHDMVRAPDAA